uniref:Uncharacterized protein n=1 Tax=Arundo donax TaxID=35708 RepID=A0A0A8Y4D4_ARUDO
MILEPTLLQFHTHSERMKIVSALPDTNRKGWS